MQKDTEKLVQNTSWEKEFEKVMGCIPECATGLYEDVGCPAHGYDAIKAIKFFRGVLSNREKEIAEEVKKLYSLDYMKGSPASYINRALDKVLQILKH